MKDGMAASYLYFLVILLHYAKWPDKNSAVFELLPPFDGDRLVIFSARGCTPSWRGHNGVLVR